MTNEKLLQEIDKKLRAAREEVRAAACPHCGYCPHCGRSAAPYVQYPTIPYIRPYITWTSTDPNFTASGSNFTATP
jgi:hypothetical protein